jgi:hypothetical protein
MLCGRHGFFKLEIITMIPKIDSKIFEYSTNSFLSLAISKGEDDNIFFNFGEIRFDFFD